MRFIAAILILASLLVLTNADVTVEDVEVSTNFSDEINQLLSRKSTLTIKRQKPKTLRKVRKTEKF